MKTPEITDSHPTTLETLFSCDIAEGVREERITTQLLGSQSSGKLKSKKRDTVRTEMDAENDLREQRVENANNTEQVMSMINNTKVHKKFIAVFSEASSIQCTPSNPVTFLVFRATRASLGLLLRIATPPLLRTQHVARGRDTGTQPASRPPPFR
jgi:hypothetical protein